MPKRNHDPAADPHPRRALPPAATIGEWRAADGWPLRRFDCPAPDPRGRILIQGGRADFIEKNIEVCAHLVGRGWSVTAFDWRGQGGSGRLTADPHVGHLGDFAVLADDLAGFWSEWRAEADGPAAVLGHSMGGYFVLRALAERRIDPAAAILSAPMLGLASPIGGWIGSAAARLMASYYPERAAWRQGSSARATAFRQRLLTHDADRFADEDWWYDAAPALRSGPPSWSWLAEAFVATAELAADRRLAAIDVPILMLIAEHDELVSAAASRRVAAALPDVVVERFGAESRHEILREADDVRLRAFAAIDRFLEARA